MKNIDQKLLCELAELVNWKASCILQFFRRIEIVGKYLLVVVDEEEIGSEPTIKSEWIKCLYVVARSHKTFLSVNIRPISEENHENPLKLY